ncbi:hypothetical protein GR140_18915 [Pseudomonas putida]|uniref:hypothetical protein n=1 Tax=Pseudomonas putida TaxID=303 RepID=UPI001BB067AF|nr:hypothetical protein [Pseudomonas putida]QUG90737.1 hypothetical protein GR140_18915 [Pseudomonas putida]
MEKVKHHTEYSDREIKDYSEFVKLAGFMDFQNLLWHRVPVGKGYPSRKERFVIESFYYADKPESNPKFTPKLLEIFNFLKTEIDTIKFFGGLKEKEMISFIKELRGKNYFKEIKSIERINELTEKEAAKIISCTFYEWEATGTYKWKDRKTREMIFEHKFYDFKNGKVKTGFPRKGKKYEGSMPHFTKK